MKKGGVLNNEGMYKKYMQHYIMLGGGGGLGEFGNGKGVFRYSVESHAE